MNWFKPDVCKIYEALGSIGDNRIEFSSDKNEAKMYSSSRNKFYTITWNDDLTEMMSNDNSAFFVGQLSYPMITVLMLKGKVTYDEKLPEILKGIKWKDINQKFKNNFDKTIKFVLEGLSQNGVDVDFVKTEINKIAEQINSLEIKHIGNKIAPPTGY